MVSTDSGGEPMIVFLWIMAASYLLVVTAWWWHLWYYRAGLELNEFRLTPLSQWPADRPAPSLAVVTTCHNEEGGIETCVRKLLAQDYPNLQILIANDRSTDRTGQILTRLAAEDDRIRIIEITELPGGWIGKTHALVRAVAHCEADYLFFTDSDVELSPHALVTAMDKVCRENLDFLSLWPHLELRSVSERLLTPPAMAVLSLRGMPQVSGEGGASQTVLGNGQFLLVKRSSYDAIGGHAGVGAELAEDTVLAARAHAAGQRCWAGFGTGLFVTYREGGFRRTVNALARVLIGSLEKPARILAGTQVLLAGGFAPVWILPAAAVCLWAGLDRTLCLAFLGLAVLHWLGMLLTLRRAFGIWLATRGSLVWFPFGCAVVAGVLFWCVWLLSGRGSVRWGSTRYRLSGSRIATAVGR
jgi:hypothetical protein